MVMVEQLSDNELLIILQKDPINAPQAHNEIWSRYHSILCLYAFRLVGDKDDARDIVSEVFLSLWSNRDAERSFIASLKGYLLASTFKSCQNWLRGKSRRITRHKIWAESQEPSPHLDPELSLIHTELIHTLYKGLEKLSPRTKQVIELYLQGLKTEEISAKLAIETQTVLNHKSIAIKTLLPFLNDKTCLLLLLLLGDSFLI
ncbi:MAG: sigma-70 family RNA polymerase sigma factor [Puia sp.]|nr:sigma-70 family RNA polymerase sigma factor [Puia sp.]